MVPKGYIYGQVMGPEYPRLVHRLELGPTPGRSNYSSSRVSTSASQDPELVSQVNELKDKVTHESEMAQIRKLLAMVLERNAHWGNAPNNIPDTTSPPVIPKSYVGSRPGEHPIVVPTCFPFINVFFFFFL